jgi:hypothetical protein
MGRDRPVFWCPVWIFVGAHLSLQVRSDVCACLISMTDLMLSLSPVCAPACACSTPARERLALSMAAAGNYPCRYQTPCYKRPATSRRQSHHSQCREQTPFYHWRFDAQRQHSSLSDQPRASCCDHMQLPKTPVRRLRFLLMPSEGADRSLIKPTLRAGGANTSQGLKSHCRLVGNWVSAKPATSWINCPGLWRTQDRSSG